MAVTDISNIKQNKRLRKMKKLLKKLLVFFIILSVTATVYFTKDLWYPYLDGIAGKLPVMTGNIKNDGELAEGNFPISISGGTDYHVDSLSGSLIVLADTHYYIFDKNGTVTAENQHTFANPVMSTADKRAVVYDQGGKSFRLISKNNTLYEKTIEDNIILASVSAEGKVAVVTRSDKYLAVLTIYDSNGNLIFTYKSYDGRITDVAFTLNGDGCIVTFIEAKGGQLISVLRRFAFGSQQEVWSGDPVDSLVFASVPMYNGTIVAVGDKKCTYCDSNGAVNGSYTYDNSVSDYACSDEMTAILFKNEKQRTASLTLISDITKKPVEIAVPGAEKVAVVRSCAIVLTDNGVRAYDNMGKEIESLKLTNRYDDFYCLGNYLYLLGYDEIDRIDFAVNTDYVADDSQTVTSAPSHTADTALTTITTE